MTVIELLKDGFHFIFMIWTFFFLMFIGMIPFIIIGAYFENIKD